MRVYPLQCSITPRYGKEFILPKDLVSSIKTNLLSNMLTVACICKKTFNAIKEYDLYTNHKSICLDKSLLIAQSAPLLSSPISSFESYLDSSSSFSVSSSTSPPPPPPPSSSSSSYLFNNKISNIFNLTVDNDIPRIVEDATLHVLRQKMAKDGGKVIEFKSGGPRVSNIFKILAILSVIIS